MKLTAKQLLALLLCATLSHTALASKSSDEKAKQKQEEKKEQEKKDDEQKKKHDDAEKKKQEDHAAEVAAEAAAKAAHEQKLAEQEAANRAERLRQEAADAAAKKAHEAKLAQQAAEQRAAREKAAAEQAARAAAKTAQERHEIKLRQEAVDRAKEALATAARKEAQWVAINGPRPPRPLPPVELTPEELAAEVLDLQAAFNGMTPQQIAETYAAMGLPVPAYSAMGLTLAQVADLHTRYRQFFSSVSLLTKVAGKMEPAALANMASNPVFKAIMSSQNVTKAVGAAGFVFTGAMTSMYYVQAYMYNSMPDTAENEWKAMVNLGKADANLLAMSISQIKSPVAAGYGLANLVLSLSGNMTATDMVAQADAINKALQNPKTKVIAQGAIDAVMRETNQTIADNTGKLGVIGQMLVNPATSAKTAKVIVDCIGQETAKGVDNWIKHILGQ